MYPNSPKESSCEKVVYRVVRNPKSTATNQQLPYTVCAFVVDEETRRMRQQDSDRWQPLTNDGFSTRANAELWLVELTYNTFINVSEVKKYNYCDKIFIGGLLDDSITEYKDELDEKKAHDLIAKITRTFAGKLENLFGEDMKYGEPTLVKYDQEEKPETAKCPRCGFWLAARRDYHPRYCQQCGQKLKYYQD